MGGHGDGYSSTLKTSFDTAAGPAVRHGPQADPDEPPLRAPAVAALEALVVLAAADRIAVELEVPATRDRDWPAPWPLPWGWFRVRGGGDVGVSGGGADGETAAEEAARVADAAHSEVVESLWAHRPTNWPPCPDHPTTHPLQLAAGDDADPRPLWTCPLTGEVVGVLDVS
ncbi:hypothetical protein [Quadrisphaera setariae]|uniref:Uncharacterized protein n=1 Tax=Quadrisphaera setariae TaxID=2593304 RepID=A0A5C8ZFX6_9ACTN|nr:hypothetical protein [Quadrisphaera setariae]TXR56762.1 hypothetical protein FMM08_08495 [Quadrisphaera setariae]